MQTAPPGPPFPMPALRQDSISQLAPRLALPLAAFAALRAYSALEPGPAAAEGAFLSLFAVTLLLAVAALAVEPPLELGAGAILATAAAWAFPAGPARGTAVTLVLVATFGVAAGRRIAACARSGELSFDVALAFSLGAQILLRGHLLFAPERSPKTLFALLGLPVLGAAAVAWLARRHGAAQAVGAAALSLTLAPGWNVSSTLGWVGIAATDLLLRKESSRWERGAALAVLLGTIVRSPGLGLAAAIGGAALSFPRPALGAALAAVLALRWPLGSETLAALAPQALWALFLVPSLVLPGKGKGPAALAALLLTVGIPLMPNPGVLAAPIALAVFAASSAPSVAIPRQVWTGVLFLATAFLASYPWLRPAPLPVALGLAGLVPGWPALLVLVGATLGLAVAGLGVAAEGRTRGAWRLAGAALALALLAFALRLPGAGAPLLTPEVPVVLEAGRPRWVQAVSFPGPRSLVVESSLSNGAPLAQGTPVATVRMLDARGGRREWKLRAGVDSGEWAALRPDVLRGATLESPAPWVSWIAGDFLAQRYRSREEIDGVEAASRIEIEREATLPPEVTIALHQVEVRR